MDDKEFIAALAYRDAKVSWCALCEESYLNIDPLYLDLCEACADIEYNDMVEQKHRTEVSLTHYL